MPLPPALPLSSVSKAGPLGRAGSERFEPVRHSDDEYRRLRKRSAEGPRLAAGRLEDGIGKEGR